MKNICELLGIKYPIIQGGMANISEAVLAAAVSEAGGLGIIAAGAAGPEWLAEEIKKFRAATNKPFGVNIMLLSPHAADIAKVVVREKVPVVTTGAGSPGAYMEEWKKAGIIVLPVVASVAFAKRAERAGADAIIAEGTEAGGHIGELTTMAFIPQAVDAVAIPVIAAGGIADKRQVLAAFALGAKGVQAGTIFLASEECLIHKNYKDFVLAAKDTDTIVTGRQTGAPVRVLKNKMAREYNKLSAAGASPAELENMTIGSLRRAVNDGNLETGSFMAGQVSGMLRTIKPVRVIIEELFNDINNYKNNLEVI